MATVRIGRADSAHVEALLRWLLEDGNADHARTAAVALARHAHLTGPAMATLWDRRRPQVVPPPQPAVAPGARCPN